MNLVITGTLTITLTDWGRMVHINVVCAKNATTPETTTGAKGVTLASLKEIIPQYGYSVTFSEDLEKDLDLKKMTGVFTRVDGDADPIPNDIRDDDAKILARDLRKNYENSMVFNMDNGHKFSPSSVITAGDISSGVEVLSISPGTGTTENILASSFGKYFESMTNTKFIPKYTHNKNILFWLCKETQTALGLPEYFLMNDGRDGSIVLNDAQLNRRQTYNFKFTGYQNAQSLQEDVNTELALSSPYVLHVEFNGLNLTIDYCESIKIKLPYVFNHYTVTCNKKPEYWPIEILYKSAESVAEIKKSTNIERKKIATEALAAIKTAAMSVTPGLDPDQYAFQIRIDGKTVSIDKRFVITIPATMARAYKFPTVLKYIEESSEENYPMVWITCNLVDEMMIGEVALPLLTPSPVSLTRHEIITKQYVPVNSARFSAITLSVYSNITKLAHYRHAKR